MNYQFEILKTSRNNMLSAINDLNLYDLNSKPKGFNNNIAWNFIHTVVVMHLLCYKMCGLEFEIDDDLVQKYSKGTSPNEFISESEMSYFKNLATTSIGKLEESYKNGLFKDYMTYSTSYNITLSSIEEAISFNNVHEGLHFGYILAQKKAIQNEMK